MPSWVDQPSYFGPNRRQGPSRRLLSRRRQNLASDPPALRTALRRLHLQAQAATSRQDIASVQRDASALLLIADEQSQAIFTTLTKELADALTHGGIETIRCLAEAALLKAIGAFQ
jgi:hypothetical protein